MERIVHTPTGIIVATGPTGSGKTTTLYAALQKLDHIRDSIVTIERKQVLAVLDKTLRMIDLALACGGRLVFRGD